LVGKSGISIDSVIKVIANAKIASPKDTTCSGFTFGTNAFVDIYVSGACVVITIIKKYKLKEEEEEEKRR
jgi:hypothetical protein